MPRSKKNIAVATEYWLTLQVLNEFQNVLSARIENAVSAVSLAINMLHQKYRGILLNDIQTAVG